MSSRICKWLPNGRVDIGLTDMRSSPTVFWSERHNSYVLVEADSNSRHEYLCHETPEGTVNLVSINGIGEVRWFVGRTDVALGLKFEAAGKLKKEWDVYDLLCAARHFGLVK